MKKLLLCLSLILSQTAYAEILNLVCTNPAYSGVSQTLSFTIDTAMKTVVNRGAKGVFITDAAYLWSEAIDGEHFDFFIDRVSGALQIVRTDTNPKRVISTYECKKIAGKQF